jgi:HSP20 family molecular chaperone IbpA
MMRDIGESIGNAIFDNLGRASSRVQENKSLPADLLEADDAYLVVFDAPGAVASDVQVRYTDDRVEVRIDRFRDFHEGFEMRYPGRGLALDGSVTLPADAAVDPETASATLKDNGTLQVRIPKVETVEESEGAADDAADADADEPDN